MAPEPRNVTVDTPRLLWTELLTEENASSPNTTDRTDISWDYAFWRDVAILIVTIVICLCGLVGNGIVIWILSFRLKRNHFSVYILNLAIADFTYLLSVILGVTAWLPIYSDHFFWVVYILCLSSYTVGLILLMVISVERCVSVLRPLWYKYHRPAPLSTIVCVLIWIFFLIFILMLNIFDYLEIEVTFIMWVIYRLISLPTFLVLFVSSLILFIRVQCYSRQRKPSRVYWTIISNVLVFLLLGVPNGVYMAYTLSMEFHSPGIWIFMIFLCPMNSAVNPIIYFFIGQYRQRGVKKPLQEVLQRALTDEDEEAEKSINLVLR